MTRHAATPPETSGENRERRRALRKPLNLPVKLLCPDHSFQACTATSVSLSGMYLQSNGVVHHVGDVVKLSFALPYDGLLKHCHMTAEVVCFSSEGFAVGFHQYDASLFRYVHKMMHETDAVSASEVDHPRLQNTFQSDKHLFSNTGVK